MVRPRRRTPSKRNRLVNPALVYETLITLGDLGKQHCVPPREYNAVLLYTSRGTFSPVTRKRIQLECVYDANGQLMTSVEAWRRFQERINGAIP